MELAEIRRIDLFCAGEITEILPSKLKYKVAGENYCAYGIAVCFVNKEFYFL
jgi:hypothetical protein